MTLTMALPSPGAYSAGPRSPIPSEQEPAIDLVHLSRQTLGDRELEIELLSLFAKQAKAIVNTLSGSTPGAVPSRGSGDLLHMLCGSARAVGSWAVAAEAQALEQDVGHGTGAPRLDSDRLAHLGGSVDRACAVIADLIGQPDERGFP